MKDNPNILPGTVIATFDASGHFQGHAAIYVNQSPHGISVYDQFITQPTPQAVNRRHIRWTGVGNANTGNNYHVVE